MTSSSFFHNSLLVYDVLVDMLNDKLFCGMYMAERGVYISFKTRFLDGLQAGAFGFLLILKTDDANAISSVESDGVIETPMTCCLMADVDGRALMTGISMMTLGR